MKKIICIILFLIIVFGLTSCGTSVEKEGTDKIGVAESEVGIAALLPAENGKYYKYGNFCDFDKTFQSIDENAYYKLIDNFPFGEYELVFAYFKYDDETYEKAKEFTFNNERRALEKSYYENEKFVFYDISPDNYLFGNMFFAYNDESNTLIFLGSYLSGILYGSEARLVKTDFEKYLSLFSKYYDFSK